MTTRTRLIGLAIVGALGVAGWLAWRSYSAPVPPEIPLEGADPELVDLVAGARRAVLDNPRDGEAWGRLAEVLSDNGYYSPAAECFSRAARYESENARWPFLHAMQLIEVGKGGESLPLLLQANAAARTRDERATTLSWIAATCIEEGRLDEAAGRLKELAAVEPGSARVEYLRGLLANASGDRAAAREILVKVKDNPACRRRACLVLSNLSDGDPELSAKYQREAAQGPPDEPWPNAFLKHRYRHRVGSTNRIHRFMEMQSQGRTQEAMEFLRREVEQSPDSEACQILGQAHYESKEYDEAAKLFRQAVRLDARIAKNHQLLGATLFFQGEQAKDPAQARRLFQEAVTETESAVALQPGLSYSHFIRGRSLLALDRKTEAIAALREAVTCTPNAFEPHLVLGESLAETGQVAEGIKHLELAVRLAGPDEARPRAALDKWTAQRK